MSALSAQQQAASRRGGAGPSFVTATLPFVTGNIDPSHSGGVAPLESPSWAPPEDAQMPMFLIAALLGAAAPHPLPAARPALVLAVQQDAGTRLDAATLRALDREVAGLWRPYADISVVEDGQSLPVAADDVLTLVITDRTSNAGDGLGWIQFVDGRPSHTIYVSRGEALRLAAQGRWLGRRMEDWPAKVRETFLRRAMAIAVAHEIGHYLLRSTMHAASGLMRAHFTVTELMEGSAAAFRLDRAEEQIMRQRVRGYMIARGGTEDVPMP
jgi:hypothetical protein